MFAKISTIRTTLLKNLFLAFPFGLVIGIIIFTIGRDYPIVGHDYLIHIPRLLDTHLHYLINGLSIQWYTPSFGSGLPAYPHPEHIQFSLPQLLLYITDPWHAVITSIAIYSLMGMVGFYLFLKNVLALSWPASILGAIFIVANGFYLEHAVVGHIVYQQFPILGFALLVLFSRKLTFLQAGVILGILGALLVHQAGFYLAVIFVLSLLIVLPLLYLMRPAIFTWRKFAFTSLVGGALATLLSISKLSAIYSFMRYFPREVGDEYGKTYLDGLLGLLTQLAGGMTFIPFDLARGTDINGLTDFLHKSTGSVYGIWETDISLSPAVFLLLIICAVSMAFRIWKMRLSVKKGQWLAIVLLLLGVWLVTDFSLAQGWLYEISKTLPVLKSLHVNVRFVSAFIFPAALLAAYSFDVVTLQSNRRMKAIFFSGLAILTIVAFSSYSLLNQQTHGREFDVSLSTQTYTAIQHGERYPIQQIADVTDDEVFIHRASNLNHLKNAMFGYDLENFHVKTKIGPVFEIDNEYYNMTNPANYVFPAQNNLDSFERFRTSQRDALELFVNRKQPDLKLSTVQRTSNIVNLVAVIVVAIYALYQILVGVIAIRQVVSRSQRKNIY